MDSHIDEIKKKIKYITWSFYCFKNKGDDIRFAFNTWQLFIRPLLDYTFIATAFCKDTKESVPKLYRNSLRNIIGFKKNSDIELINSLIQYNYNLMPAIAVSALSKKWEAYKDYPENEFREEINTKVKFPYIKLEMRGIPHKMISTYNILTTNNWCKECTTNEKKVRLSLHHVATGHNIDVERNIKTTIQLAKEAYSLFQDIKKEMSTYDTYKRKICKQDKCNLINKINNIKEYWIKVYNIIVSMIWE